MCTFFEKFFFLFNNSLITRDKNVKICLKYNYVFSSFLWLICRNKYSFPDSLILQIDHSSVRDMIFILYTKANVSVIAFSLLVLAFHFNIANRNAVFFHRYTICMLYNLYMKAYVPNYNEMNHTIYRCLIEIFFHIDFTIFGNIEMYEIVE